MTGRLTILLPLLLVLGCDTEGTPDYAARTGALPTLDAWMTQEHYVSLLSNRWSDEKAPTDFFIGEQYHRGTMEPQGAGSRYHARWSFKVVLDAGEELHGLRAFNLSAQIFDRSMLRTVLGREVFGALGFPSFTSWHVFLRLNGRDRGLYAQIERVEEDFFRRRGLPVYELLKASFGARFSFKDDMLLDKYFAREIPKDGNLNGMGELIEALDAATDENMFRTVGRHLDIRGYLRYHAAASILNHQDGFANNLLFYKRAPTAPFEIIPWDFDKLLYDQADVGLVGPNDIIAALFRSDSCIALYKSEARAMLDTLITPARLFPLLDATAQRIGPAWALDPALGLAGFSLAAESSLLKEHLMRRREIFLRQLDTISR